MKKNNIEKCVSSLLQFLSLIPSFEASVSLLIDSISDISVDVVSISNSMLAQDDENEVQIEFESMSKLKSEKSSQELFSRMSDWVEKIMQERLLDPHSMQSSSIFKESLRDTAMKLYHEVEKVVVPVGSYIPPTYNSSQKQDNSIQSRHTQNQQKRFERARDRCIQQTLSRITEALNLRCSTQTVICVNGFKRKRTFELYQFSAPIKQSLIPALLTNNTKQNIDDRSSMAREKLNGIKIRIEEEFQTFYHSAGENSNCRVYACCQYVNGSRLVETLPDGFINDSNSTPMNSERKKLRNGQTVLYIQINVGKRRSKSAYSSKGAELSKEYIAVVRTSGIGLDYTFVALATSGKIPSSLPCTTPYVLTAIGMALCTKGNYDILKSVRGQRKEQFTFHKRPDPLALLHAANIAFSKSAVGRYSCAAAKDERTSERSDALSNLNIVSTRAQFKTGDHIKSETNAEFYNTSKFALDKTLKSKFIKVKRKTMGMASMTAAHKSGFSDCPKKQKICWKWIGNTSMAANSFQDDDTVFNEQPPNEGQQNSKQEMRRKESMKFKCGIVLEGHDVFAGLGALVQEGMTAQHFPTFVQDAPLLGGNVILVQNGKISKK